MCPSTSTAGRSPPSSAPTGRVSPPCSAASWASCPTPGASPSPRRGARHPAGRRDGHGGTRPLIGYVPQSPSFDRGDPVSVLDFFHRRHRPVAGVPAHPRKVPGALPPQPGAGPRRRPAGQAYGGLSGGQLQRVLLALALEPVPHILVLDEPLSGVDIEGEHQLLEMLDELRTEYDLSILLSTHDFATLGQFADKVILLNKRVLRMGPPEEVTASPEFYETFHLRMGKGARADGALVCTGGSAAL